MSQVFWDRIFRGDYGSSVPIPSKASPWDLWLSLDAVHLQMKDTKPVTKEQVVKSPLRTLGTCKREGNQVPGRVLRSFLSREEAGCESPSRDA